MAENVERDERRYVINETEYVLLRIGGKAGKTVPTYEMVFALTDLRPNSGRGYFHPVTRDQMREFFSLLEEELPGPVVSTEDGPSIASDKDSITYWNYTGPIGLTTAYYILGIE